MRALLETVVPTNLVSLPLKLMKDLSSKQGQNGLPKAPDTKTVPSDVPPPPPDNNAAKTLEEQQSAADQTESQVVKEAFSQGS